MTRNQPGPIRVLHVLHRMHFGGVESWLMAMLRLCDPTRLHMDFLVHGDPGVHEAEILRLGGGILRANDPHRPRAYAARLTEVLKSHSYDVVHSHLHGYSGAVLRVAARCGVPIRVAHSHNVMPSERGIVRRWYAWMMRRWIRSYATAGLAASPAAQVNLFGPATDPRWQILYCGFATEAFRLAVDRGAVRRQFNIPDEAFVVGHVGRMVPQKNHAQILKIAAQMPDAWFLLIGDGDLQAELQQQAKTLGIVPRVIFAGGRSDIPALLRSMDVFVFPSLFEGLGLVAVEAQAAGLPVVMADTTPPEAVVIPTHCTVLSLKEPIERWATALRSARTDPAIDAADQIAQSRFDHRRGFEQLVTVYGGPR